MRRTFCFVALVMALAVTGCVPPPPPATPRYLPCSQNRVEPFQCTLWVIVGAYEGTSARGVAWTTEPATFIQIELTLEQQQPDGTFTGIWTDRSGLGAVTQHRDYQSGPIQCQRGNYRWHMRVQFTGHATTYWSTSPTFWQAGP
jgi:hypothetical protein